jgi:2-dehydro-3-deoxyphosphooctonate aldolase (KDO 8-P synthase)
MYEGLKILKEIKNKFGIKVTSDIHDRNETITVSEVVDLVQIPALLSRQTDLLKAAGCYSTSVNIKKGQFAAPWDIKHAVEKVKEAGCDKIFVTERGTSFGYNRLVVDMASFHIMRESMPDKGVKFIFDATHSCQLPGAGSGCSSGNRDFVPILARAAIAAGADGIFIEVHNDPDKALCDGPNSLALKNLEPLLKNLLYLQQVTTVI